MGRDAGISSLFPDFCAVAAQKSGREREIPLFLPTLGSDGAGDLTVSNTYVSTIRLCLFALLVEVGVKVWNLKGLCLLYSSVQLCMVYLFIFIKNKAQLLGDIS